MYSPTRGSLPPLDLETKINHAPHVVILGAGASRACCPTGDLNSLTLPVMADYFDALGLSSFLEDLPILTKSTNLEQIYSELHEKGHHEHVNFLEKATHEYFSKIQIPDHITVYDKLLLSLRKKDVVISFNWDPLICLSFQRLRSFCDQLPTLLFLHGNVEIGVDRIGKRVRFRSDLAPQDEKIFEPSSLLYPVTNKDYTSDTFIAGQWKAAAHYLQYAYFVTVFGYSAPVTDVAARKILLDAWQNNPSQVFAELEFIDIAPRETVEKVWDDFLTDNKHSSSKLFHYSIFDKPSRSYLFQQPRRTCDAFAFATLQCDPWHEDPLPDFSNNSWSEVKAWLQPYLEEEKKGQLSGNPLGAR